MSHRLRAVGIDIGSRAIKFVGADARTGECRVSGVIPRLAPGGPIDRAEIHRIGAILRRRGVWSQSIVLGAPPSISSTAMLELPPRSSGAPIDRLAKVEMARIMRCEPDTIETVAWDVPFGGKAAQYASVMAVACATDQARSLSDHFEDAGLLIEAIEPPCIALARAVRAQTRVSSFITIDLGASSGRICVVTDGAVTLERELGELGMLERLGCAAAPLGLGPDNLWQMLQERGTEALPITRAAAEIARSFTERLATDVKRAIKESIGYVRSRGGSAQPELAALAGWGSQATGLAESLTSEGDLRAIVIGDGSAQSAESGVCAPAAGLSLRPFEEDLA